MRFSLLGAVGVGAVLIALPAHAQVTDTQVGRVVEAIRQASKPDKPTPGLYSDWQVKPENISRWSKQCLKRDVSPAEFQVNRTASRRVVTCVVRDVLQQELRASKNDESQAVQRVAAWWLTGDGDLYNSREASPYVQRVLSVYQSGGAVAAKPSPVSAAPKPLPTAKPVPSPVAAKPTPASTVVPTKPAPDTAPAKPTPAGTPAKPAQEKSLSFYDRYMQAGNAAMAQKDTVTAALYFRRALDEHPQDKTALQALRSVEAARSTPRANPAPSTPVKP